MLKSGTTCSTNRVFFKSALHPWLSLEPSEQPWLVWPLSLPVVHTVLQGGSSTMPVPVYWPAVQKMSLSYRSFPHRRWAPNKMPDPSKAMAIAYMVARLCGRQTSPWWWDRDERVWQGGGMPEAGREESSWASCVAHTAITCTELCFWNTLTVRLTSASKTECPWDCTDAATSCPMAESASHHCRWGRGSTGRLQGWGHGPSRHHAAQAVFCMQAKAIPVSLQMHYCVCFQWLQAVLLPVINCKAGQAVSPGWWGGEAVCGQPPPCMVAAVGDNSAWQTRALRANAVSIREGSSNLGQPKADPQAGEEEKDLQRGCSSGVRRVHGADQGRSLCGMSIGRLWPCSCMCNFPDGMGISLGPFWLTLGDLLMLSQECSKGRAVQVTFPTQIRIKVRKRFRVRVQVRVISAGA